MKGPEGAADEERHHPRPGQPRVTISNSGPMARAAPLASRTRLTSEPVA